VNSLPKTVTRQRDDCHFNPGPSVPESSMLTTWLPSHPHPVKCKNRHSLQFTINKIVYKIFGAMSKDLYIEICEHFGIESVENLVAIRRNCFIKRYGETDNYLCQMLR